MRPTVDRSQSALLPLHTVNTDQGSDNDDAPPITTPVSTARRNRAHTVAVALGPSGRRGSGPNERRRRGSSSANPRNLEEGREREGSPVHFELGNEQEELDDEVVGMLDVIDPEVSTGTLLSSAQQIILTSSEPLAKHDQLDYRTPFPCAMVTETRSEDPRKPRKGKVR